MTIHTSSSGSMLTVTLTGRLDTATAPALEEMIRGVSDDVCHICFDFSNVEYITSAGLRTLLICQKKMVGNRSMKIVGVTRMVKEIFDMTGFSNMLHIEEGRACAAIPSFGDFLREKTETRGDAAAFSFGGQDYTWRDIRRNANAIAAVLARKGVRRRAHVAICGLNSPNWIFTFFAIQQLGAIAVLLNYGLTPAELAALCRIGDITHICYGEMPGMIADPAYMAKLTCEEGVQSLERLRITRDADFTGETETAGEVSVEADDPAVMIFTSGSTALPKAVLLSSYTIFNSSRNITAILELTERDSTCLALPLFHIFGFMGVLIACFTKNARLFIPQSYRAEELLRILSDQRCTVMLSVPTLMLSLAASPTLTQCDMSSLRSISLAGAAIPAPQLKMLMERFPHSRFSVGYGLSEIAPAITTKWRDTDAHVFETIGTPCDDVLVRIQSPATKRECAVGEAGEILLKSPNQMVCYYKLDIDKQPIDSEGWLHTGDLGFIAADGYIHLCGRIKELIIRGGENIAPNEVASAIATHPMIADVAVFGISSVHWGEEVVAALILQPGAALADDALRAYLRPLLGKYKIPAYFCRFERFPLLSNGKVDMLALKKTAQELIDAAKKGALMS